MFLTGPGPDGNGSKAFRDGWAHSPEKSGIDAVRWLGSCVNAADDRVAAAVMARMNVRMINFSLGAAGALRGAPNPRLALNFNRHIRKRLPLLLFVHGDVDTAFSDGSYSSC